MSDKFPVTGDILHTRGNSLLNKWSRFLTRSRGEAPTKSTHSAIFYDSYTVQEALLNSGVTHTFWENLKKHMEKEHIEWMITTPKEGLNPEQIAKAKRIMDHYCTYSYSILELVLCGIDGILALLTGKDKFIARKAGDILPEHIICSKLVGLYMFSMKQAPRTAEYWTPDDVADEHETSSKWFIKDASDNWENVK